MIAHGGNVLYHNYGVVTGLGTFYGKLTLLGQCLLLLSSEYRIHSSPPLGYDDPRFSSLCPLDKNPTVGSYNFKAFGIGLSHKTHLPHSPVFKWLV